MTAHIQHYPELQTCMSLNYLFRGLANNETIVMISKNLCQAAMFQHTIVILAQTCSFIDYLEMVIR